MRNPSNWHRFRSTSGAYGSSGSVRHSHSSQISSGRSWVHWRVE